MNTEAKLRSLRTSSLVVTIFAALLLAVGVAQLGLGAMAVSEEYDRIEELEQLTRQSTYYGYQAQQAAVQAEYNRSGSRFFAEGRFLSGSDELTWSDPSAIAFLALVAAALGFFIAAMIWVWRAHANIIEAGVRAKYTPGKALAAYLLPVANLIFPFEAMRELHNRSHGEPEDFAHSSVEDVTAWWTAVIVGLLIFSAMIVKMTLDAGTNLILMTPLWMEFAILAFAIVLLLVGALLFAGLTRRIAAAQAEFLPEIAANADQLEEPARQSVRILGGEATEPY
ncbi:DUF4328 domain-containing protein [Qipengyuania vesicularis]|uniref:DUF4328 domain-containing protein n=1 Tax=Qipengyuania vesicularis TaxID=2867232 RepID=UPI001C86B7D9|nr:DUF4328 domain-containing protein [Qipengyuania vesicularis]MBX7527323.1 DUF4328 domain-containing protein [Qipengyuania vesicularis]